MKTKGGHEPGSGVSAAEHGGARRMKPSRELGDEILQYHLRPEAGRPRTRERQRRPFDNSGRVRLTITLIALGLVAAVLFLLRG